MILLDASVASLRQRIPAPTVTTTGKPNSTAHTSAGFAPTTGLLPTTYRSCKRLCKQSIQVASSSTNHLGHLTSRRRKSQYTE